MRRLTAISILLFASLGNFAPLALAAFHPLQACCLRKAHHCHSSSGAISQGEGISLQANLRCSHDCCSAAIPTQRAQASSHGGLNFTWDLSDLSHELRESHPASEFAAFVPARAPPAFSQL